MIITFNLELSNTKGSNNEHGIFIRCTQNRKHRRINTGISIPTKSWDKTYHKIKRNHPLYTEYNKVLDNKLKQLIDNYATLIGKGEPVTLDALIYEINIDTTINFFEFATRTKMTQVKSTNKLGTFRRYESVLNKFKLYAGNNLNINKVDYSLLRKYELYLLKSLNNGRDTVSSNLSVIRAIINEAIRHGVYKQNNPFDQIQLKYTNNSKEKLTSEELYNFFNTKLPNIPSLLLAKDFFLACFLAEGTRAGDMLTMQKENIINDCLVFNQQKTGKKMVIPISTPLEEILNRYVSNEKFIFPLLNKAELINEITINSKLTYINKYLKEIAKYCGIFKKLSTHVARHTYTDLALEVSHGNIYQVQQSLGHSSVKTTEIYSRNRVNFDKISLIPEIIKLVDNNSV